METDSDFHVHNSSSMFVIYPHTDAAFNWLDKNVSAETKVPGGGVAVDKRYVEALINGILKDGLTVS